eukprot:CAMPEP_0194066032 /NCGR_PEP_ID=MMETSP0009_2-20130614/85802_1 /TAXON_ID=210454 /ORGANISM="Grammatophora oceanica, Strain CCMP 410" /LENGTH=545 /DNA_ID=CAMNT_0038718947 /DNA_START=74 /DNA_END=1711 /DNA_ORIENTATION=-
MSAPPSKKKKKVVGTVDIGRKKTLSEEHTIRFDIHQFESLPSRRGQRTQSSSIACHGSSWSLRVYPGGCMSSDEGAIYVGLFLQNNVITESEGEVTAKYRIRAGPEVLGPTVSVFTKASNYWGYENYLLRSDFLNPSERFLVDGTLTVEVDLQVYQETPQTWVPTMSSAQTPNDTMRRLFASPKWTDIVFRVGAAQKKFQAHRSILSITAPTLCRLSEEAAPESEGEIEIPDMQPAVFRSLLRFMYLGELPDTALLREQGQHLLEAADRFECKDFKLRLEAAIVESSVLLNKKNAAKWLLFADSHWCALLKEASIDIITKDSGATCIESDGWKLLKKSPVLLSEIMEAQHRRKRPRSSGDDDDDIESMSVSKLRSKLEGKGLDVDGDSRDAGETFENELDLMIGTGVWVYCTMFVSPRFLAPLVLDEWIMKLGAYAFDWVKSWSCAVMTKASYFLYKAASRLTQVAQVPWVGLRFFLSYLYIRSPRSSGDDDDDIESMSVSKLRSKLEGKGLDIDGNREMLVKRLKTVTLDFALLDDVPDPPQIG